MTEQHTCAAERCEEKVRHGFFMCKGHWRRVPIELRHELRRAWRRFGKEGTKDAAIECGVHQSAAVKVVAEKEQGPLLGKGHGAG